MLLIYCIYYTILNIIYCHEWQRKASSPHIKEAGRSEMCH